jgi:electron transport complex protein RnfB
MHAVIDELCTGCELCVPVCPVDCISMVGASGERTGWDAWDPSLARQARERHARHVARADAAVDAPAEAKSEPPRRDTIAAVLARARAARAAR